MHNSKFVLIWINDILQNRDVFFFHILFSKRIGIYPIKTYGWRINKWKKNNNFELWIDEIIYVK